MKTSAEIEAIFDELWEEHSKPHCDNDGYPCELLTKEVLERNKNFALKYFNKFNHEPELDCWSCGNIIWNFLTREGSLATMEISNDYFYLCVTTRKGSMSRFFDKTEENIKLLIDVINLIFGKDRTERIL